MTVTARWREYLREYTLACTIGDAISWNQWKRGGGAVPTEPPQDARYTFCVNIWSDFQVMTPLLESTDSAREIRRGCTERQAGWKRRREKTQMDGAREGKEGWVGRGLDYGQLNEITRNRKLSDVPILLERPSATQKWWPWAELVAHNVDVHDDVRDDTPPRRKGIRRVVPTRPGAR